MHKWRLIGLLTFYETTHNKIKDFQMLKSSEIDFTTDSQASLLILFVQTIRASQTAIALEGNVRFFKISLALFFKRQLLTYD